jgi:carboxypeptidase C (cathepsin A)
VISFLFSTLLFIFLYIIEVKKNRTLLANTLRFLLEQEINKEESKTDKEQANEAFLKFISDSRDWAYTYIDEVQDGLNKFISDVQPEIAYFDEYGVVGSAYPHYHSMKKISVAYKELKKLLPEDYGKIDT